MPIHELYLLQPGVQPMPIRSLHVITNNIMGLSQMRELTKSGARSSCSIIS